MSTVVEIGRAPVMREAYRAAEAVIGGLLVEPAPLDLAEGEKTTAEAVVVVGAAEALNTALKNQLN